MSQPARFAARTRALCDRKLSHGAARLYSILDDQARGHEKIAIPQPELCELMNVSRRMLGYFTEELITEQYLTVTRLKTGNLYEFLMRRDVQRVAQGAVRHDVQQGAHVMCNGLHKPLITQENPREESSPTPPYRSEDEEDLTPLAEAIAEHVPAAVGDIREIVTAARRSKPAAPIDEIAAAVRMAVPPRYQVRHHRYFLAAVPRIIGSQWFRNAIAARAAPVLISGGDYAPYQEPDEQRRGVA